MQNNIEMHGYMQVGAQQGWQCSVCQAVNSPWLQQCLCEGKVEVQTTVWPLHDLWPDAPTVWINCPNCSSAHQVGEAWWIVSEGLS